MRSLTQNTSLTVLTILIGTVSLAQAETTGQYVDDATITTKIKAALIADTQLKALSIKVETDQGVVQLSGTVDTKTQESEAIKVANQISGVKTVKDIITVKPTSDTMSAKGGRNE